MKAKLEERIQNLELQLAEVRERNLRVEADKAWETSRFRVFSIVTMTYIIAAFLLYAIGVKNFFLSALVPAVGYYLSTQSLPFVKWWWIARFRDKKEEDV